MKTRFNRKYRKTIARMVVTLSKDYAIEPKLSSGQVVAKAKTLNAKLVKSQFAKMCETWGTPVDFDSWVTSKLIRLL